MRATHKGFTLIASIYLLLFVAIVMTLMLAYTTQTVRQTSNIYLKEQAKLLSRSATEFALLAVSAHDRTTLPQGCVNYINSSYPQNDPRFDINTTIRYFGMGALANCKNLADIKTSESNGTILIDVYVSYKFTSGSHSPITHHKRTLQKP